MKKPSKTAAELEASIKVEMEDICDWPTDMAISVQPDGDSWKVAVMQEGLVDDANRREMVEEKGMPQNLPSQSRQNPRKHWEEWVFARAYNLLLSVVEN